MDKRAGEQGAACWPGSKQRGTVQKGSCRRGWREVTGGCRGVADKGQQREGEQPEDALTTALTLLPCVDIVSLLKFSTPYCRVGTGIDIDQALPQEAWLELIRRSNALVDGQCRHCCIHVA